MRVILVLLNIVFNLPSFPTPVLFGKLRLQVDSAHSISGDPADMPVFPLVLNDVTDISLLQQPLWDLVEWQTAKTDLLFGRRYGNFSVLHSPVDDGKIIEVPLTYDAIYDVNTAAGGNFAIGIGPGEGGWAVESESVLFNMPDTGGVAQLVFTLVPTIGRHHGKNPCKKIHYKGRKHKRD